MTYNRKESPKKNWKKFDLETYDCPAGGKHVIETYVDEDEYPYGACTRCKAPSRYLDATLRESGVQARQYRKPDKSSRMKPPRKSRSRRSA